MQIFFNQTIQKASTIITQARDFELSAAQFAENVFNRTTIVFPKLNLERTKVEIKKESISYRNAPPGIRFSMNGNTVVEHALYAVPISGDREVFVSVVKRFINRSTSFIESGSLFYREYSEIEITGNDSLIGQIKGRFVNLTTQVNNALQQAENQTNEFYEQILKPTIERDIEAEIAKRKLASDSLSKLNPFI